MRISCSVCSTTYEVPDQTLAVGRKVRCAKCGHQWVPRPAVVRGPAPRPQSESPTERVPPARLAESLTEIPPVPMAPPAQAVAPDPLHGTTIIRPLSTPQPPRRRAGAAAWLGWVASLAVWVAVLWAAYAYRTQVMDAWPPAKRLYAALGLGPGS
jgi:predicted Zn finger-like uncharacterized protein